MTHTPGPWEIIQLPSMQYRIDAKMGPLHVCPAIAHSLPDATLIAAAPDLLEAASVIAHHCNKCDVNFPCFGDRRLCQRDFAQPFDREWDRLLAAITKATEE